VDTRTETWTYQYDAFDNRDAVTRNGQRIEYLVDPTGLGDVVGEYSASGATRYVHGYGLIGMYGTDGPRGYEFDGLGNVVGMTALDGIGRNRYVYAPFGGRLFAQEAFANAFQFAGQFGVMHQDTGMEYMRARFYAPAEGRFTSQDPLGFAAGDVNWYRY